MPCRRERKVGRRQEFRVGVAGTKFGSGDRCFFRREEGVEAKGAGRCYEGHDH